MPRAQQFVYCKGCKKEYSCVGWAQHCTTHHARKDGKADADDDDGSNDGSQHRNQSKANALVPAMKTVCRKGEPVAKRRPVKKK